MATQILVNIDPGNGLLPDGTKLLPKPVLTKHQCELMAFTRGQLHGKCWRYVSIIRVWKLLPIIQFYSHISQGTSELGLPRHKGLLWPEITKDSRLVLVWYQRRCFFHKDGICPPVGRMSHQHSQQFQNRQMHTTWDGCLVLTSRLMVNLAVSCPGIHMRPTVHIRTPVYTAPRIRHKISTYLPIAYC